MEEKLKDEVIRTIWVTHTKAHALNVTKIIPDEWRHVKVDVLERKEEYVIIRITKV